MFNRQDPNFKKIEISLGLLVGTIIGLVIHSLYKGESITENLWDVKYLCMLAGVILSASLLYYKKKNTLK